MLSYSNINDTLLGGGSKDFLSSPRTLGKIPILTNIFQMGWNHQHQPGFFHIQISMIHYGVYLHAWWPMLSHLRVPWIHPPWKSKTAIPGDVTRHVTAVFFVSQRCCLPRICFNMQQSFPDAVMILKGFFFASILTLVYSTSLRNPQTLHPGRLTWNQTITFSLKRETFIFQTSIFWGKEHVNFPITPSKTIDGWFRWFIYFSNGP